MAKNFKDLSEREALALAIALEEEEDGRIYGDFEEGLRDAYPPSAKLFEEMNGRSPSTAAIYWTCTARNSAIISRTFAVRT